MKNYNEQNKNEVAQRRNDGYLFDPFFGDFFDFPAFSHHEFRDLEKAMKAKYKLTTEDKLEKLNQSMNLIHSFMDVLK